MTISSEDSDYESSEGSVHNTLSKGNAALPAKRGRKPSKRLTYDHPPEKDKKTRSRANEANKPKKTPWWKVPEKASHAKSSSKATKQRDLKPPPKKNSKTEADLPIPPPDANDEPKPIRDFTDLRASETIMSQLRRLITRETILGPNALLDKTTRQRLLLIHIVQEDVSFNMKNNVNDTTSLDSCKCYTKNQCLAVTECVAFLHRKYYNVDCRPDPPPSQGPSSEPSSTPFLQPHLNKEQQPADQDAVKQPVNVDNTKNEVVVPNKPVGDSLCSPSPPPKKRPKRNRTGSHKKYLYCSSCGQILIKIRRKKEGGDCFWIPEEIVFEHREACNLRPASIRGITQYPVDCSVLDAAEKLMPLATKWYDLVKHEPSNSILFKQLPGDNRFYGLFYHEFAPTVKEISFLQSLEYLNKEINFEELRDFRKFHELVQPLPQDQTDLMELVVLFIEDFKFQKRIHYLFQDRTNFLGAVGFLAGGMKTQKLHCDVPDIPPRCRDTDLPHSVLLPIGPSGRSLFFENTTDERSKHHIARGDAVWFDGNVPHAGAKSKAKNPLDNLALHIHIDSTKIFRKPNVLELFPGSDVDAWDSDDEKKTSAK